MVEVTDWSENRKNPVGKIISVIGEVNNHNAEIHSILYEYDLSPVFPEIVTEAAKKTSLTISKKEINSKRFKECGYFYH